jgi:hypothetical protein
MYSPSKERNEWKVQDNHLDVSMDDTSSLPTTNIINLSYDRSKFFLVFFLVKKKNRSTRKKTCKKAIKSNFPWWLSLCHTLT